MIYASGKETKENTSCPHAAINNNIHRIIRSDLCKSHSKLCDYIKY